MRCKEGPSGIGNALSPFLDFGDTMSSIGELGVGGHDGDYTAQQIGKFPWRVSRPLPRTSLSPRSRSACGGQQQGSTWLFRVLVMAPRVKGRRPPAACAGSHRSRENPRPRRSEFPTHVGNQRAKNELFAPRGSRQSTTPSQRSTTIANEPTADAAAQPLSGWPADVAM